MRTVLAYLAAFPSLLAAIPLTQTYPSGRYIISFKDGVDAVEHTQWARNIFEHNAAESRGAASTCNGIEKVFRQLNAYVGDFDEVTLAEIRANPDVLYVEPDQQYEPFAANLDGRSTLVTQTDAAWSLGAISHRELNTTDYVYDPSAGEGHTAYIVDSGINVDHVEFGGRASLGYNAIGTPEQHIDHSGHGTHVAGTIGAATYGVAKKCQLISVKISNSTGWYYSGLIDGIDWALDDMIANNRLNTSVVNISGGGAYTGTVDNAIRQAYQAGMTIVAAAGNGDRDASRTVPAASPGVITVASVDRSKKRAALSNWGRNIDIFAPGEDIRSTWIGSTTATHVTNGTSMAAPHVAGVVLYLQKLEGVSSPDATLARLVELSTKDVVSDPKGSPNRFLYTGAA